MIQLNTQIADEMEIQKGWNIETQNTTNSSSGSNDDEIIQELAEQFGLGITRQGGNY